MSASVQPFIEYLEQLQRKGQKVVHLDDSARMVLREFYALTRGQKKLTSVVEDQQQKQPTQEKLQIQGNNSQEKINSLIAQARQSDLAKNLGTLRDQLVFSSGNPDADVFFICDAPGYHEEMKGHPFAGPAGEKLDGILKAMGLTRESVYITHLMKYRPAMPNQSTANRKPSADEIDAFAHFLTAEIEIVQPKVIVALGSVVAQHLLNTTTNIDHLRGKFHQSTYTTVPILVTYHPSYLLQTEAHTDKRKLWEDMLALMAKLGMPISEKQQQFFLPKP